MTHDEIRAMLRAARLIVLEIDFGHDGKSREDASEAAWWLDKAVEDLGKEKEGD